MTIQRLSIEAPSRLHFGLASFDRVAARSFSGIGLMIQEPPTRLIVSPADRLSASGPGAERVVEFAKRWGRACRDTDHLRFQFRVEERAPDHVGLGSGTQLGLAVAAALCQMNGQTWSSAAALAEAAGRGLRSSVGTHGFLHGGLIFDAGKAAGESLGRLGARVELPEAWRIVLICPPDRLGLSGSAELQAFRRIPPIPAATTALLLSQIESNILPAAEDADFDRFSEAIYAYGRQAGLCFAAFQGGPFATPQLERWIQRLRDHGVRGVGQSSWGPTLFALTPSASMAKDLAHWAQHDFADRDQATVRISRVSNRGARCVVESAGPISRSPQRLSGPGRSQTSRL